MEIVTRDKSLVIVTQESDGQTSLKFVALGLRIKLPVGIPASVDLVNKLNRELTKSYKRTGGLP
jgi:hypothetical protein